MRRCFCLIWSLGKVGTCLILNVSFQENKERQQCMSFFSVKSRRETALRLPLGELDSLHPAQILVSSLFTFLQSSGIFPVGIPSLPSTIFSPALESIPGGWMSRSHLLLVFMTGAVVLSGFAQDPAPVSYTHLRAH